VLNLKTFDSDKTVVMVTDRLSTVKNNNLIIALDNEEIAEIGSYEALTNKRGKYY
jgi:ABC-type bacteriocin/lantibiotic exporter with double-glycine peptidase domain